MIFTLMAWLEQHDKLAGWAQFSGSILALVVTYFTAFTPMWRRKRQLLNAAKRLLLNGYEAIESYHRTSAHFLPFPLSVRSAALTMTAVVDETNRFPIYELDDQGSRSVARHLLAMSGQLNLLAAYLEHMATELESREATKEDQANIREFVGGRLEFATAMLSGAKLTRPEWPAAK